MAANMRLPQVSVYNRRLIETSLDPLATIDASGKVTDVNRAMEKVTGYPRDRLIGIDFTDFLSEPAQGWTGFEQVLRETIKVRSEMGKGSPGFSRSRTR
jgi:PAS domain S-box-containing protein